MEPNYWGKTLSQRISRRRAIVASGATAAAAALLAACGGSSSKSGGTSSDVSKLLTEPVDTSKQAKRGGTLKRNLLADPPALDPMQNYTQLVPFYETVLGRLVGFKPGKMAPAQEDQIDGDAAESWEFSPDRLQITLKLRSGVKWHNIAPVNGRDLDADDILFTWKRFSTIGNQRGGLANIANPDAPILSVSASDAKTIVIKLKSPILYALSMFGARENVNLMPKEADNTSVLDARNKMIGTGPYYMADYQRSVGITLKRHEGFYDKNVAYADQIDYPIIPEYAAQMAQLRTGGIWVTNGGTGVGGTGMAIRQEDVLPLKSDLPDMSLYVGGYGPASTHKVIFGWKTPAFRDERVRQAFSMSYDRDLFIDVWNNASKFEAAGVPVERRWFGSFPQINDPFDGWRLEPRDAKSFGPNAKYFQKDIAEAKRLLSAAGFANGLDVKSTLIKGGEYGSDFQKMIEVRQGMNAEAGMRFTNTLIDYQTEFIPQYRDAQGNFEGIGYRLGPPPVSPDPVAYNTFYYHSKSGNSFLGFDVNGKGDNSGDPYVDSTLTKAQQEPDTEKRRGLIQELERYLAQKTYSIMGVGGASSFVVVWPVIQNYRAYRGGNANTNRIENEYWWVDDTKPPLKKA